MSANTTRLRVLVLIQLISISAMEMSGPFLPLQLQRLLGPESSADLGLLSALVYAGPMLAAMCVTPVWGRLGDLTGHKPMIIRALLALALCQALAALTNDAGWLVAIRVLQGALAGFIATAQAYAMTCCQLEARGAMLARLQTATAVGSLLGPVSGGLIMDSSGFALLSYSASLICLLCAAAAALFLPSIDPDSQSFRSSTPTTLPVRGLFALLGIIALIQAAKMLPLPFYALYVKDVLLAPGWLIGASYAVSAATLALSAPLWNRLFQRWQPGRTLRAIEWVCWACTLTMVYAAMVNEWMSFLISRLMWGIWQGALLPVAYALIAKNVSTDRQGFALGLGNSAAKAGALCGVIIGGIGFGITGLGHAFWLVVPAYAFAALGIRALRATSCGQHSPDVSPSQPPKR